MKIAEGLMELSHDYANRIHGNSTLRKMTDTSGRYYDQFWAPIAKELKGVNKVYISLERSIQQHQPGHPIQQGDRKIPI